MFDITLDDAYCRLKKIGFNIEQTYPSDYWHFPQTTILRCTYGVCFSAHLTFVLRVKLDSKGRYVKESYLASINTNYSISPVFENLGFWSFEDKRWHHGKEAIEHLISIVPKCAFVLDILNTEREYA